MAFKDLTLDQLRTAAEFFGVEVEPAGNKPTKKEYEVAFLSDGITWDQYKQFLDPDAEPEVVEVVTESTNVDPATGVLLVMQRENPTFVVRGYKFTKEHPFVTVTPADADYIVAHYTGFRPALPSEAERYYR